jgi:hypothetical protein
MAEPTVAEVQHLADVIAAARLDGEPLDTHLARIVLAAGYRFVDPDDAGRAVLETDRLIEESSLGTPEAKALRESVPDDVARAIVERSKQYADEPVAVIDPGEGLLT